MSVESHRQLWGERAASWIAASVRARPLAAYFVLAYGLSWLELAAAGALGLPAVVTISLTTLAPTVAAVIVSATLHGRAGVTGLLRRLSLWRGGPGAYAAALVLIPLAYLAGTLVLPGALAAFAPQPPVYWAISAGITFALTAVLGGPLFEEPGWRGFALPRLQVRFGPLGASLVLGVLWGCWHLPQYLVGEWAAQNGGLEATSVATFLLVVVAFTVVMTWIWNVSGGSLLLAVLAHAALNASQLVVVNQLFPAFANTEFNALIGLGALALAIAVATRGTLGYRRLPPRPGMPAG